METNRHLVFQSDFGLVDGAVAAMTGVALSVDIDLHIHDLTHNIPPFDTYEASFRLLQTVPFWPKGTVFVSVVDPGVGSRRKSLVVLTKSGHYIVTPNNGTLTHILHYVGIEEAREIKESVGRRKDSEESYTFHGRDVFAYTGALLASGQIAFKDIGRKVPESSLIEIEGTQASLSKNKITGAIETLDVRFGSLWTNIPKAMFDKLKLKHKDEVELVIYNGKTLAYRSIIRYVHTFAEVDVGEVLCYVNSMNYIGVAINQGNFASAYNIGTREPWHIEFIKRK